MNYVDSPSEYNPEQTKEYPNPNFIQRMRNHAIALLATAGLLFGIKAYQERTATPPIELPPTPTHFSALSDGGPVTIGGHEFLWVRNDPRDATPIDQLTADQVHLVVIKNVTPNSEAYYIVPISSEGTPVESMGDTVRADEALTVKPGLDVPANDSSLEGVISAS